MSISDLEAAALALPLEERRVLAQRIWESMALPGDELTGLLALCDAREREADADPADGWMPVTNFMNQIRARKA